MNVEKNSLNVITIRFPDVRAGWEQWFLLSSDRHHDSADCNRELETQHLELARDRKAYILDFGDIFDVMQGKYDPRRSYPDMRPEYLKSMQGTGQGYLDVITKDAADFYGPWADMFLLIAQGNHETAIKSHNDVDLIGNIVHRLNVENNTQIVKGCYGGWVRFLFTLQGTQQESQNLKYFHGSGGGGPVTKGTIQTNRQAVFLPDADTIVNGHIHESWEMNLARERLSNAGVIYTDLQRHIRTGTYKNDYRDGSGGWHVERGAPPKPQGAVWMRFYYDRHHVRTEFIQDIR